MFTLLVMKKHYVMFENAFSIL